MEPEQPTESRLWRKVRHRLVTLLNFIWSKWALGVMLTIFLYGPFAFIQTSLFDPSFDTLPITNTAFAILAGMASLSFSWARSIEPGNKNLVRSIVYAGEVSFQSAILFLLASAFKYVFLEIPNGRFEQMHDYFRHVFHFASMLCFGIAVTNFIIAIVKLSQALRARMKAMDKAQMEKNDGLGNN